MGDFPLKAACSPVDPPASELASLNQGEPLVLSDPHSAVTMSMLQLVKRVAPQVAPVDTRPSASSGGGDPMKLSERMKQSRTDAGIDAPTFGTVTTRATSAAEAKAPVADDPVTQLKRRAQEE